ncbi:adenylate kinase [Agrobacterium tumefaciens]|uniref:adenylate kinase n=1 Tax=Agrobacterium tumefaciens TaxID=358 RepID=UPI001CBAEF56|nr:adenylate kinase [Agrobacterium tumefaciens]
MVNLVLIGPPGSGKGTQAERLVAEFSLLHLSTGDLLRDAIKAGTPLGKAAQIAVDSGELVPDEVVIGLVEASLLDRKPGQGFILDGFPRTEPQALALETLLHRLDESLDHVVVFEISAGLLRERIALRASQSAEAGSAVRTDDTAQVLEKRILEFERATAALMPFYERRGLLRRIDARMPIGAVTENILRIVKREDV